MHWFVPLLIILARRSAATRTASSGAPILHILLTATLREAEGRCPIATDANMQGRIGKLRVPASGHRHKFRPSSSLPDARV
jgi:oxalate decarboxylase/phosphoglucose isomerase-like protein (cupin superfamily)